MRRWLGIALACALVAPAAAQADVTVKALEFKVTVGPEKDQECTVVADLYTPDGASKDKPVPAIMGTNGFGGSKGDFTTLGPSFAKQGYAFLAYSGLGFGGSGCKITLDDREHDGAAGSQLLSFLGGEKAAEDGTRIDYVKLDGPGDPRVGMVGGSYGGQIQFAVAGVDKRLDTIIPIITWNDLSYALSPNNTDLASGVTYTTPGVVKLDWPVLFFGLGTGQGLAASLADPSHLGVCPNFADAVCPSLIGGASRGYLDAAAVALLRNASVSTYMKDITIPVFLSQGQSDNLFNLQESVATYKALKAQGTPVKLLWRSAGHSGGGLGKAEYDPENLEGAYETRLYVQWFDHYLKGTGPKPAEDFSFITDWVEYEGDAAPAVGTAPSYPAGTDTPFYLSGSDALVTDKAAAEAGGASVLSVAAPTSTGGGVANPSENDPEGTAASWTTPVLETDLDVAGVPSVTFSVDAPSFGVAADPAQLLILHAKLKDVAPDGTSTLVRNQISAARIPDPSQPITIEIPGQVHRYAKGHRLRLTISTSAATYRGGLGAGPVTIKSGPESVLTVPVLKRFTPLPSAAPQAGAKRKRAAKLPKRRPCRTPKRIRFRLRAAKTLTVAHVRVNGKRVRTIRGRDLRRRVQIRLRKGAKAHVVVTSRTKSGELRRNGRRYRACVRKK